MSMSVSVKLTVSTLAKLADWVSLAGRHPQIGHQSLSHPEVVITQHLNRTVEINKEILLSALWSVKMLEELESVTPVKKGTFKQLIKELNIDVDEFYFWEKEQSNG